MQRLFVPSWGPSDWRRLLASPATQWKRNKSAFELAVAWEAARGSARGLPGDVAAILDGHELTRGARLVLGLPELQVDLPGGGHASQTDLWALVRTDTRLVSVAVEAKSGEPFDKPVSEWLNDAKPTSGKPRRLEELRKLLAVGAEDVGHVRYQLLHRSASAILQARDYSAAAAMLLVQSFGGEQDEGSRQDFARFAEVMNCSPPEGVLVQVGRATAIPLLIGWLSCKPAAEATLGDAVNKRVEPSALKFCGIIRAIGRRGSRAGRSLARMSRAAMRPGELQGARR